MYKQLFADARTVYLADAQVRSAILGTLGSMKRTFMWMFLSEVMLVVRLYPVKLFVDGVLTNASAKYLLAVGAGTGLFMLIGSAVNNVMDCYRNDFNMDKMILVWGETHAVSLRQSADFHVKHGTGEKESLLSKNAVKVELLLDSIIFDALPIICRIVFTSVAIYFVGWRYGLLALGTLVAYVLLLIINEPRLAPLHDKYHRSQRRLEQRGSELFHSTMYIRSIGREEQFTERNRHDLRQFAKAEKLRHRKWRFYIVRLEYLIAISTGLLYIVAAYFDVRPRVVAASEIAGSLALVIQFMDRIHGNFYRLTEFQRRLQQGVNALRELLNVFLLVPKVVQPQSPLWPNTLRGNLVVRDVNFQYPDVEIRAGEPDDQYALRGVNLTLKPGTITGVMGHTGCGKSTLVKLLELNYHPTSGSILLDGVPLTKIDTYRYRQEAIAVVHQRPVFFNGTIRQNIRVGNPSAPKGYEEDVARMAFAHEFIAGLPQGYETVIGEGGPTLSGGQLQRLAIARALFMNPKVLILDEATSSLDLESEKYVQEAIDGLIREQQSMAILIIAHRLKTIANADQVVVMEQGRIVQCGTHEQLAVEGGRYMDFQLLNGTAALTAA